MSVDDTRVESDEEAILVMPRIAGPISLLAGSCVVALLLALCVLCVAHYEPARIALTADAPIAANARFVAATDRDLATLLNRFRQMKVHFPGSSRQSTVRGEVVMISCAGERCRVEIQAALAPHLAQSAEGEIDMSGQPMRDRLAVALPWMSR